jgi:AP2 domain/HNH endonuclease
MMHHLIMGHVPNPDTVIDHINRNGLDNRRVNLREVTRSFNRQNARKQPDTSSGFIGVSWNYRKRKWRASITKDGRLFYLGDYKDEKDAARAYDAKALELFGPEAKINEYA